MNTTLSITPKKETQFLFSVSLNYHLNEPCILSAKEKTQTINSDVYSKLGQHSSDWNPEQLLLGALASCYMSTLNYFLKRGNITIDKIICETIGSVELLKGKLRFKKIDLYPNIYLSNPKDQEAITEMLIQTQQNCMVANTLNTEIVYHHQILNNEIK